MKKIQSFLESAGKGSCLALCYIKSALGENATPTMLFDILWKATEKDIIDVDDNCYVNDAIALMKLANPNKSYTVEKQTISSLDELKGKLAAVNYENNGFNHWVLVEKGKVVFDSLDDSKCVKYGVPTSARIIEMEDK